MSTGFAITNYPDVEAVSAQLDALIKKPIYSIQRDALKRYEEQYFGKKCSKSKAEGALLNECGPSTGLFHEYEYKLAKKICDSVPTDLMPRLLQ